VTNRSDEFGWKSGEVEISMCARCRHYSGKGACLAFAVIPDAILTGDHDHRQPYPGDGGTTFTPMEEAQGSETSLPSLDSR
jgi:hypothetical protein